MNDKTYNGWTNYATWRVNLEMFDGCDLTDYGWQKLDKFDLAQEMKEYAEEFIELESGKGLARDYALAFLSEVNWREIAHSLLINHFSEENLPIPEKVWEA
jgi:hypothetical protein